MSPKTVPLLNDLTQIGAVLVRKCRVQKVVYDTFSVYVIRLKVSVPQSPGSAQVGENKFLTRMKDTNFFQVLSIFEAAFPFASDKEKESEIAYIEGEYKVQKDPKVKGIWLTGGDALKLAKEYGIEEYVLALQEASPNMPSETLLVTETVEVGPSSPPSTPKLQPEAPRRSRRSASPKKPKAPKAATKGRKKKGSQVDDESVRSSSPSFNAKGARDKLGSEAIPILDSIQVGVFPSISRNRLTTAK